MANKSSTRRKRSFDSSSNHSHGHHTTNSRSHYYTPTTFVWAVILTSAIVNICYQWWLQARPSTFIYSSSILFHNEYNTAGASGSGGSHQMENGYPTTKDVNSLQNLNSTSSGDGGENDILFGDSPAEEDMEEIAEEELLMGESRTDNLQQQIQSNISTSIAIQQQKLLQQTIRDLTQQEKESLFPFGFAPPKSTPIFYHIYVPKTLDGIKNSKRIVFEQLDQIDHANQIQLSKHNETLSIYFNLIGHHSGHLNSTLVVKWCTRRNLICTFMNHHDKAMEDVTLQRVHDYCRATTTTGSNIDDDHHHHNTMGMTISHPRVVYMHNKGSYTRKPPNERWRYKMTDAVSSDHCLHPEKYGSDCNLCGMFFTAERGLFMAGNFWTATCDYISQLLPVHAFEEAMSTVASDAFKMRLRYLMYFKTQELRAGVFGIDRYSTEFWSASHPNVKPCDYSKCLVNGKERKGSDGTNDFLNWIRSHPKAKEKIPLDEHERWWVGRAPHLPIKLGPPDLRRYPSMAKGVNEIRKYADARHREFFFLAGNLFKWYRLYGQAPPQDSWVYHWFPDGEMWKDAVAKYGENATTIITQKALHAERVSGRNPNLEKIAYTENKTATI